MHDDSLSRRRSRAAIRSSSHGSHRLAGSCQSSRVGTRPAGALLPSARLTASAFGAALSGVIANGLGFDQMTRPDESKAAASWTFAGFVPPALLGCLIAWRFSNLIAGDRRPPPHRQ